MYFKHNMGTCWRREIKVCLEDTRLELHRLPENDSLISLLGDQKICNMISNALTHAPYVLGLWKLLPYRDKNLTNVKLMSETIKRIFCLFPAGRDPQRATGSHCAGERDYGTDIPGYCRKLLCRHQGRGSWKPWWGKGQRIQSALSTALPGNVEEKNLEESPTLSTRTR